MEVEATIKQMASLKSPGPDGFKTCFYQKHWSIVGDEVSTAVLSFLNGNALNAFVNFTYIAFIPKIKCPLSVSEYMPISLCNVLYKILSKILAHRLKKVLSDILSPN